MSDIVDMVHQTGTDRTKRTLGRLSDMSELMSETDIGKDHSEKDLHHKVVLIPFEHKRPWELAYRLAPLGLPNPVRQ